MSDLMSLMNFETGVSALDPVPVGGCSLSTQLARSRVGAVDVLWWRETRLVEDFEHGAGGNATAKPATNLR